MAYNSIAGGAKDVGHSVAGWAGALVGDTYHSLWDFVFLFLQNAFCYMFFWVLSLDGHVEISAFISQVSSECLLWIRHHLGNWDRKVKKFGKVFAFIDFIFQ